MIERRKFLQALSLVPAARQVTAAAAPAGRADRPPKRKLVMIGAGSVVFTQGIIVDWVLRKPEGEWEIALVDINPPVLEATAKMVRRYMLGAERPAKISASTDRRDVLPGATVVVCTIGVGSRRAWEQDVFVPRKFGIFQPVGDSVMPGGVSRAMRMIPPMVEIAKDAERLCPQARFFNYSNPMTAVVRAVRRQTSVEAVGLCHGLDETLKWLATVAEVPDDTVTAKWAGVNHLTWITEMRSHGKDLLPKLREKSRQRGTPFSWELFGEFSAFPAPRDRHVTEFFSERFPNGRYYGQTLGVDAFSFEGTIATGDKRFEERLALSHGQGPIPVRDRLEYGEHGQFLEILDSIWYDGRRWFSANVPNRGAISNLPNDCIVEVPITATADGIQVPPLGELPPAIAAIILRRAAATEAVVEAAVRGNRKLMVEAMILDGGISDYSTAAKLADAMLKAQAAYLRPFA